MAETTKTTAKSSTGAKKTTTTRKTSTTTKKPVQTNILPDIDESVEVMSAPIIKEAESVKVDSQVELLKQEIELLKAQLAAQQSTPPVVRLANEEEKVVFMWNAEVADWNQVSFGPNGIYGTITGKYGTFFVPKSELSRVMDNQTRAFLRKRWLVVISGLSEEEKKMLDLNYKSGELLSKDAYKYIVEMEDKILEIYPDLHLGHKEAVAKRYYDQWKLNNPHVKRDVVLKLIKMSAGDEKKAFQKIIEEMNEKELRV